MVAGPEVLRIVREFVMGTQADISDYSVLPSRTVCKCTDYIHFRSCITHCCDRRAGEPISGRIAMISWSYDSFVGDTVRRVEALGTEQH